MREKPTFTSCGNIFFYSKISKGRKPKQALSAFVTWPPNTLTVNEMKKLSAASQIWKKDYLLLYLEQYQINIFNIFVNEMLRISDDLFSHFEVEETLLFYLNEIGGGW